MSEEKSETVAAPVTTDATQAKDAVSVEKTETTRPITPSAKEIEDSVEQSAEHLAQQSEPMSDGHHKPTTPSNAEVEEAVEQSTRFLQTQGTDADVAPTETRDKGADAAPVSAGGANPGFDAAPVYGGRDKAADASPVFSSPVLDKPSE